MNEPNEVMSDEEYAQILAGSRTAPPRDPILLEDLKNLSWSAELSIDGRWVSFNCHCGAEFLGMPIEKYRACLKQVDSEAFLPIPLWKVPCRACRRLHEIEIEHLMLHLEQDEDRLYKLLLPVYNAMKHLHWYDFNFETKETKAAHPRWKEIGCTIQCPCGRAFGFLEKFDPLDPTAVHTVANTDKNLRIESVEVEGITYQFCIHLEFPKHQMRFGIGIQEDDDFEIRGRCLYCNMRHDLPEVYRIDLLNRWVSAIHKAYNPTNKA